MNISANSLFHFTGKKQNNNLNVVVSILENGFLPDYCYEDLTELSIVPFDPNEGFVVGIPMVCFCDIPLSKVKHHTQKYGELGIGLSKKWAKRNGINPVIYVHLNAKLLKTLKVPIRKLYDLVAEGTIEDINKLNELNYIRWELFNIINYLKPLKDDIYDEREWRYIPTIHGWRDKSIAPLITLASKYDQEMLESFKNNLQKKKSLQFGIDEINYIIVPNEGDHINLIDKINKMNKFNESQKRQLATKVINLRKLEMEM